MYLILIIFNFSEGNSSIYLQISVLTYEDLTVMTSRNIDNLRFILPSSTSHIQDKYFPGIWIVLSHELFYDTPKLRFRQVMLLNYMITISPPPPQNQLYESFLSTNSLIITVIPSELCQLQVVYSLSINRWSSQCMGWYIFYPNSWSYEILFTVKHIAFNLNQWIYIFFKKINMCMTSNLWYYIADKYKLRTGVSSQTWRNSYTFSSYNFVWPELTP